MGAAASSTAETLRPRDLDAASRALLELGQARRAVRPIGARTKLDWGAPLPPTLGSQPVPTPRAAQPAASGRAAQPAAADPAQAECVELETGGLDRLLTHDRGDLTAVLQAGTPLSVAQATFAEAGQRLALDPPLGTGEAATIGGVLAAADSGPLRHRYGAARDLVIGATILLADGTIARSGGKVIKNVAGYDLAKLFVGSLGTLGVIAEVCVRLHPLPSATATLTGASDQVQALAAAATTLARLPLEAECLDVCWSDGAGRLLARFAGPASTQRARATATRLRLDQLAVVEDDEQLWRSQRQLQRRPDGVALRVSALPSDLAVLLHVAQENDASLVARAALGTCWLGFAPDRQLVERVAAASRALAPRPTILLDGAAQLAGLASAEATQAPDARPTQPAQQTARTGATALIERVKRSFDPDGIFRPGVRIGAI